MRNALNRAVIGAAMLVLTACGGGGGGGGPESTPVSASLPATTSQSFQTQAVTVGVTGTNNTYAGSVAHSNQPSHVQISYDATAGTYTITENAATATFAPAARTSSGNYDIYTNSASGVTDELKLFGNARPGGPQAGAPVQLSYLTFGTWTRTDSATGNVRKSHFVLGYPTASASMPSSGTASYQTMVTASMFRGGIGYPNAQDEFGGTATFVANFSSGTVSTHLSLIHPDASQPYDVLTGTGTVQSQNQFAGTFSSANQFFTNGSFKGGFFGPAAAEMGYSFQAYYYRADPYAGASIAPQHTYITGAVVGKKQ